MHKLFFRLLRYKCAGFLEYSLGTCDVKWSFTSCSALLLHLSLLLFLQALELQNSLCILLPSLCCWFSLLNLSADVQLNCVKKYSIGISLIYHSILLISISLSSLLTFFTYFTILYLVFAVHQDWRIKSLTEV